ncbi:beta-ketoacyl synthase N-terminal-like domain-containing protein [Amycolatopsis anabasis]|uniref:beta-ketoacyl synthase N-terminal-like domain-containing protein n=1 Tax=Amycolatopsis anabasis TaxID=1840409 RepID=UPI00131E1FF1|nr:beta-ketoacyl synthase N-terminal-like domain-containing protein [Amycolatopsis anabasis]
MTLDITGIGAVASIGGTPEDIHDALCAGTSGVGPVRAFDRTRYRAEAAYEIDDRAEDGRDEPRRATRWLVTAVRQALADAGLLGEAARYPVLIGTTHREQRTAELWWRGQAEAGFADLHFGAALREEFGSTDVFTFANACAASLYTLGLAQDLVEAGAADTVIVAGTDSITESSFGIFDRIQYGRPPSAVRPFDKERRGMVMGEGAVAVVVERPGAHDRRVRARVRGVSVNCDGAHPTQPAVDSVERAVRDAHRRAGVTPADIDLVMLHGTGTVLNDQVEAAVLRNVFEPASARPVLTAIKSMTGHTLGGSGLLSLLMAVLSIRRERVPPIIGLDDPMDEVAGMDLVRDKPRQASVSTAQVDAFGLSGINAVAVLEGVS